MHKFKLWGFVLLTIITFFFVPQTYAKEYSIPDIRVEVTIMEDGTVRITEHRTYVFDGNFSWADYRLPLQGFRSINNIEVWDENESYINENSEFPGSFSVARSNDAVEVTWYYQAVDESRTFSISYELEGALVVGPEWVEFFWSYVAAGRQKPTDNLDITITLPQSVDASTLYGWSRGAREDITITSVDGGYNIIANDLSTRETALIRTVFPRSVLSSSVATNDADFSLEWARQDEQDYRTEIEEQREREAFYNEIAQAGTILLIALSIWCFYHFYRKYGKRFEVRGISQRETIVIPNREKPAAVSWLLYSRSVTGHALVATLLDLARSGYFNIHEQEAEEGWFSSGKPKFKVERTDKAAEPRLLPWEKEVLDMAESRIAEGDETMDKLFSGTDSKVAKWFSEWKKDVHDYCMAKGWIDEESYTGAWWNGGLQFVIMAAGIALTILGGPIALAAAATGFVAMMLSMLIVRRTEVGEREYAKWKAYSEGLKNIETYTYEVEMLDKHFIYGTALQMNSNQLENLFASADRDISHIVPWIVLMPGSSHSPADMASAFSTLAATGASSSVGTSGGGGASAGSAGGGASGGAG